MRNNIYDKLMILGTCIGCHQRPDRSFFYKGHQFPVCARCTGVLLGQIVGVLTSPFYTLSWNCISFFCFLMFLDWYLQRMKIKESTNIRRLITGMLCGFALGQLYVDIILRGIAWGKGVLLWK